MECTKFYAYYKNGIRAKGRRLLGNINTPKWLVYFALALLSVSYLAACQPRFYEGITITTLETGTPLLDVRGFRLSPNGQYIIMDVVEKKDDIPDMRLRTDAADLARHLGKGKIQVVDLTTQAKLVEFSTEHYLTNFAWSPDLDLVYYRHYGRPTIVKLDIATGQQATYHFPYAGFDVHPITGLLVAWGKLVEKSSSTKIYETLYTNEVAIIDPVNMLPHQEVVLAGVSNVFEAIWGVESNDLLIRGGLSLYYYDLSSETVLPLRDWPYTRDLRNLYNPRANVILLKESEGRSRQYLIYDTNIDCVVLQTNVEIRLDSPIWHGDHYIIALRLNEDRSTQFQLLKVNLLATNTLRQCIKNR